MSQPRKKKRPPKGVLALPDLEQSKAAVLNSLTSKSGQRTNDRALTGFVEWYCSEPRLAFSRTVFPLYRIYLEQKQYAPTTINLRLTAVRRVAFEAGSGLQLPDVKEVRAKIVFDPPWHPGLMSEAARLRLGVGPRRQLALSYVPVLTAKTEIPRGFSFVLDYTHPHCV